MAQPAGRDRLLAGVSAAQLATGLAGMVVGLRIGLAATMAALGRPGCRGTASA